MTKFKVGAKIRLRDGEYVNHLSPTGVCTVSELIKDDRRIRLEEYAGTWLAYRFELVEETPVTVDLKKPVQTRDGRKVRVICTDRVGQFPVIALVMRADRNHEENISYTLDGKVANTVTPSITDLMNVPEKRWINLYKQGCGGSYYPTEEDAKRAICGDTVWTYVKTIEVEL